MNAKELFQVYKQAQATYLATIQNSLFIKEFMHCIDTSMKYSAKEGFAYTSIDLKHYFMAKNIPIETFYKNPTGHAAHILAQDNNDIFENWVYSMLDNLKIRGFECDYSFHKEYVIRIYWDQES